MKKCIGCGSILQNEDSNKLGYTPNLNQDYCQRCFRLTHYGDIKNYDKYAITNNEIIDIYDKYKDYLFILIIDVLDVFALENDDLLNYFRKYKTYLLFNKIDLLPDNNYEKITNHFLKLTKNLNKKYPNIVGMNMLSKYDDDLKDHLFDAINYLNIKNIVFAGRANAGKSTIINKLLQSNNLTTSIYPGTTLNENIIEIDDYKIVDTPGLIDESNCLTHLSLNDYKKFNLNKQIKPKTFQLNSNQVYFYDGILYFEIKTDSNCSITFYMNNNIEIHRSKLENSDNYYQKHYGNKYKLDTKKYSIDNYLTFVFKGLGIVKINGQCDIEIKYIKDSKIYTWKENI